MVDGEKRRRLLSQILTGKGIGLRGRRKRSVMPGEMLMQVMADEGDEEDSSRRRRLRRSSSLIAPPRRNLTVPAHRRVSIEPLPMRLNVYYYRVYYVGLNVFFAAVLPLALLLFLNVRTAHELFKMGRAEAVRSPITIGQRKVTVR